MRILFAIIAVIITILVIILPLVGHDNMTSSNLSGLEGKYTTSIDRQADITKEIIKMGSKAGQVVDQLKCKKVGSQGKCLNQKEDDRFNLTKELFTEWKYLEDLLAIEKCHAEHIKIAMDIIYAADFIHTKKIKFIEENGEFDSDKFIQWLKTQNHYADTSAHQAFQGLVYLRSLVKDNETDSKIK